MLISIFASIWSQNIWDELILKNEITILERKYWEDTQFIVFSYDPETPFFKKKNVSYREYFPLWIKDKKNIFKNIANLFSFLNIVRKSDRIVIGWWWIIYDTEKEITNNPLDMWWVRAKIFKFFGKKVEFFRVWIDIKDISIPAKWKNNLEKVREIFSVAEYISVRDVYSHNLLSELWIKSALKKDPVFYDRNKEISQTSLIKSIVSQEFSYRDLNDIELEGKRVWIAFRKWYLTNHKSNIADQMEEGKINEIINFILESGWEIVFLPHSFHEKNIPSNDYVFLKQFLRKEVLQKFPKKISITKSMDKTYKYYKDKKIDICLAQRLHSIVLSHVYEIPFIGISYGRKTHEILQSLEITKN